MCRLAVSKALKAATWNVSCNDPAVMHSRFTVGAELHWVPWGLEKPHWAQPFFFFAQATLNRGRAHQQHIFKDKFHHDSLCDCSLSSASKTAKGMSPLKRKLSFAFCHPGKEHTWKGTNTQRFAPSQSLQTGSATSPGRASAGRSAQGSALANGGQTELQISAPC